MRENAIETYMTASVHTIDPKCSLADADHMMRELNVRHLPVVDRGVLLGIISDRDLSLVKLVPKAELRTMLVERAMSPDVFTVTRDTPLAVVAQRLAKQKLGSAVVTNNGKVAGIFTSVDAMKALDFLLSSPGVVHAVHAALLPAEPASRKS